MTENQALAVKGILLAMRAGLEGMQKLISAALALLEENPDAESAVQKIRGLPKMFGETQTGEVNNDG